MSATYLLQATRTIPIVLALVADPIGAGFVESLSKPGATLRASCNSNTVWPVNSLNYWVFEIEFLDPARAYSETRDQSHDLSRGYNGAGVVREIDVESGVHVLIRIVRHCVLDHRDLVTELSGKANSRFDAGMRYLSYDNELMDAVLLELQIQICVGEATGTPMLCCDNLTRLGRKLGADLTTPRAVFEALVYPCCLLNGGDVLPSLIVARTVSMMQCIEDPKLRIPRGIQDLQHMRNTVVRFCNGPNSSPQLTSLGDEVVVRIDHQKSSDFFVVCQHLCVLNSLTCHHAVP